MSATGAEEGTHAGSGSAAALAGSWVGDELQRALARGDALAHELAQLRVVLQTQQDELARLHERLSVMDGRTLRHEAGQDLVRELSQRVATVHEQIEAEMISRRELAAQLERTTQRDREAEEAAGRATEQLMRRVDQFEGRQAAGEERQRDITSGLAEREQDDEMVEGRLIALERHVAADRDVVRHTGDALSRVVGEVPALTSAIDDLRTLVRSLQLDQRRIGDEVAAQRAIRDREADLLDVLEQQRATRARTEERLNAAEEQLEEVRRAVAGSEGARTLLAQGQAGIEQRMRTLGEAMEQQRQTLLSHLRRQLQADDQAGRKRIEEIERASRVARDLVVRLSEESDELRGGPPP